MQGLSETFKIRWIIFGNPRDEKGFERLTVMCMALYPRQNSRFAFDVQVYNLTLFFTMRHLSFIFNIAA